MTQQLYVTLCRQEDLLAQREYFARGGFFVPAPEPLPEPFSDLAVTLLGRSGRLELRAQVVQIAPGAGVALACADAAALAPAFEQWLQGALEAAGQEAARSDWQEPAAFEDEPGEPASEGSSTTAELRLTLEDGDTLFEKLRSLSMGDKRKLATDGDRTTRQLLLKDPNKTLHLLVLRNRNITIEEVRYLAGFRQANPEALNQIAEHREWSQNPLVVMALVSNPKTPGNTASRLLHKLSQADIRRLAKSPNTPRALAIACRKLVAG